MIAQLYYNAITGIIPLNRDVHWDEILSVVMSDVSWLPGAGGTFAVVVL